MEWVAVVVLLTLIEYLWFGVMVGNAREKFSVPAPAVSGNEMFERYFRVQQNTLELLPLFVPAIYCFARYISPFWAAGIGAVFIAGRAVYAAGYLKDPKKRSLGFGLSALPILVLLAGGLFGALRAIIIMARVPVS
jgi:glutathione S-transferase